MKIAMKYPRYQNEIYDETPRHSYNNYNEIF